MHEQALINWYTKSFDRRTTLTTNKTVEDGDASPFQGDKPANMHMYNQLFSGCYNIILEVGGTCYLHNRDA